MPDITTYVTCDDGSSICLTGTGYATRCAAAIAGENFPDARWALEVLNRYGHLVEHEADRLVAPDPAATNADTMERAFGSALHVAGGLG